MNRNLFCTLFLFYFYFYSHSLRWIWTRNLVTVNYICFFIVSEQKTQLKNIEKNWWKRKLKKCCRVFRNIINFVATNRDASFVTSLCNFLFERLRKHSYSVPCCTRLTRLHRWPLLNNATVVLSITWRNQHTFVATDRSTSVSLYNENPQHFISPNNLLTAQRYRRIERTKKRLSIELKLRIILKLRKSFQLPREL